MAKTTKFNEPSDPSPRPQIIGIGCDNLSQPLLAAGYLFTNFADNKQVKPSAELGMPRLFVVRSTAVWDIATEDFISHLKRVWPLVDLLLWAPRCSAELAINAMKSGAKDVLMIDATDQVLAAINDTIATQQILPQLTQKNRTRKSFRYQGMVSRDPKMWDIFDDVERVAQTDTNVLILGETGTGKELLSRAIHKRSGRQGRFVAVNCAAIPENLLDSELFGHVRGAFTGAQHDKKGLFRFADGGTILLDEIGNMPLPAQYHLLRVLQENKIRPVGGHEEIPVDTRVIAATSRPLSLLMAKGRFREDLFYRLDVMRLTLPPLRDRPDDIVFIFSHFLKIFTKQHDRTFPHLSDEFIAALTKFKWPGNVRQLVNTAERLVLTADSNRLTLDQLHQVIKPQDTAEFPEQATTEAITKPHQPLNAQLPLREALGPLIDTWERSYFVELLKRYEGRINQIAAHAQVDRRTVHRKLRQWQLNRDDFKKSRHQQENHQGKNTPPSAKGSE